MSSDKDVSISRRQIGKLGDLISGTRYTIRIKTAYEGHMLEMGDVHFHHDSAVVLADYASATDEEPSPDSITGLAILCAALHHARENRDQMLLVAGHTDRSGSSSYNQQLSELRARNVLSLLRADRAEWMTICDRKHKVEDYQHILSRLSRESDWNCDPGKKDNVHGPRTRQAVMDFQTQYNGHFGASIETDGVVGPQTWGAIHDVYLRSLAETMGTDVDGLREIRSVLNFVPGETIGCGEDYPISSDRKKNYRNPIDRRVEILFFEPDEIPAATASGGMCEELYGKKMYTFTPIPCKPVKKEDRKKNILIRKLDNHFAPKHEELELVYEVKGVSTGKLVVEVESDHYGNNPVFRRELTADEKSDGPHTIRWDGMSSDEDGELAGRFIHPLYAPYRIRIHDEAGLSDEASFNVLYHSVALKAGPWMPDESEPDESDRTEWTQFKLNELGYFGGPVGNDFDDYLKKAVIRYKANHKDLHQLDYSKYDGKITDDLVAALKSGDNRREAVSTNDFDDPGTVIRIRVEALTYEAGEFSASKSRKEEQRLNRPLIPMEAIVSLKSKAGSPVEVPEATGPVRINWRIEDPDENLSHQFGDTSNEPSKTRKYIEKCLKLEGGRKNGNGDNCHEDFGGIRAAPAAYWRKPFLAGKYYQPYEVKEDPSQKVVYSRAWEDPDSYPKRRGKAGVFFRPSTIAGDDYRVIAELDFTERPNRDALEKMHGVKDVESRVRVRSGLFQIWRFSNIAVQIHWPKRTNSSEWNRVKTEFDKAYLDLDVSGISEKKISDVISEEEYQLIVKSNTSHKDESKISIEDDSLVGVALPSQGNLNAAAYRTALNSFTNDNYWDKIYTDLREKLSENIRKTHPTGFIVVDFLTHKPVTILKSPPADTSVVRSDYITWSFSIGLPDSVIFADQKDPDKVYYVVAHEMGHNFWLKHWEHAGGSRKQDHDQNDHNCALSYSSSSCGHPHHRPGTYTPHFCGQCNLKLRGWDVDRKAIPARS